MRKQAAPQLVPRTRSKTSNHQAAAETAREPAGPAFQRLTAELAAQQALVAEWAAEAAAQQARGSASHPPPRVMSLDLHADGNRAYPKPIRPAAEADQHWTGRAS